MDPARSALMRRVAREGSKPELIVRRALHGLGFRYALHRRDLPGSPDLVFPARRAVIFVHGCFWHRHAHCPAATTPKTRTDFWTQKFEANQARDARASARLQSAGWKVHVVWECEAKSGAYLEPTLDFLRAAAPRSPPASQRAIDERPLVDSGGRVVKLSSVAEGPLRSSAERHD